MGLGVLQRLSELAAGMAGAEFHQSEPRTQSRGISNTATVEPDVKHSLNKVFVHLTIYEFNNYPQASLFLVDFPFS